MIKTIFNEIDSNLIPAVGVFELTAKVQRVAYIMETISTHGFVWFHFVPPGRLIFLHLITLWALMIYSRIGLEHCSAVTGALPSYILLAQIL